MADTVGQDRESVSDDSNAWFFKETALDELLASAQPLRSMEDLAAGATRSAWTRSHAV